MIPQFWYQMRIHFVIFAHLWKAMLHSYRLGHLYQSSQKYRGKRFLWVQWLIVEAKPCPSGVSDWTSCWSLTLELLSLRVVKMLRSLSDPRLIPYCSPNSHPDYPPRSPTLCYHSPKLWPTPKNSNTISLPFWDPQPIPKTSNLILIPIILF